jgi:hypothetical protein
MPVTDKYEYGLTVATSILGTDYIRIVKDPSGTPLPQNTTLETLNNGGWIPVTETWTYASASTITTPSGGTAKYQKGMKIRFKQTGDSNWRYYVATTVATSLITVMVNTDYAVSGATITDISYSFADLPFGWPDWFTFAPVFSSSAGTITSYSVVSAKARIAGKKFECFIEASITNNGTGSGTIVATIPVTPITILVGSGRNATTGGKMLEIYGRAASGAVLSIVDYSGAYPAATGDTLRFWANCDI